MSDLLKLGKEAVLPCYFELRGRKEMLIDGFESLVGYEEKEIRFICGGYLVKVQGNGLKLEFLNDGKAVLRGILDSFEFSGKGEKNCRE